jgi:membrane fusion protein, multidrug efflux system
MHLTKITLFYLTLFLTLYPDNQLHSVSAAEPQSFTPIPASLIVTLTGFTRAKKKITITSQVSDKCLRIKGKTGQVFNNNDPLIFIDRTAIELELRGNSIEQKRILAVIQYLKKEENRYKALLKKQATAQSKFDSIEHELNLTEIKLKALKNFEKKLNNNYKKYTIHAPHGWKIIKRFVEPGEIIRIGQPLVELGNYQELIIPIAVSMQEFQILKETAQLKLWFPEVNQNITAEIHLVYPDFDPVNRKINLELILSEELPVEHRGGIRAELTLKLPNPSGGVIVPKSAVEQRYEEYWLTRKNSTQVKVMILEETDSRHLRVSSEKIKPQDLFLINP